MAENNIPISPLDPLGPSYGKINPPSIDAIGLSAFEGEKLSMKPINFPAPTRISVPGNQSVQRPNSDIRQNIVGSPPNPAGSKNPNAFRGKSSEDIGQTFVDYAKAISQSNQDKNEYARIYSYDAGPDSGAFYKRYAAYGQEKFDAVGFHPFRDNEAIFNAKTTGWNDFSRMMTHAAVPLFTRGFVSGPKSLMKMLSGDFTSADTEDAKIYAEAAAIGQSSKGGLGSFLNNAAMNFSYSAGIITEALIEEGVGLLLAAPTGGTSVVATTANVGRNLFRLGKGIDKAMDLSRATTSTLKSLDNISNARSFWSAAKSEKALKSPLGRFINPVENLTESIYSIAKNEKNLTGLARTYDAGFKTVGGFYKDVRSLNMALSEARLEAGMQQNDIYKELYNEHYLTTGTAPTNEQQQQLLQTAKEAGTNTLGWNIALIYFSNKLVIPNIVGPRGGIANFLKSKTEDIINLENGFIRKSAKETVLKSGKKVYTPEFSYVKKGFKNTLTSFYKDPLSKSIKGGLTYFKGNISEGIQENLQEVISEATKNYYVDKYKNPTKVNALSTFDYAKRLTTDALNNQFSAQGFETFASGFVMGMFAAPLNGVPAVASLGYNKIFNKEGYAEYKAVRDNYGNDLAKNLNSISIPEFFDSNIMNYTTQLEADDLGKNGTEKEAKDSANAAIIDQLKPMLKHGTVNEFKDYLTSFKNLTPEEFEEVVNAEQGTGTKYLGKIDEVIGKVNKIQKRYDYWTEKFPNPISQQQLESLKGTPDYETAQYLGTAWNMGIENAIYFNESFEDTSSRMASIINDVVSNSPLQKASATDVKVLFDEDLLDNEIGILDSEVKSLKESELPESKKSLNKKSVKLEEMKKLKVLTQGYKDFIANRKNIVEELTSKGIAKEDIDEAILEANNDFLLDLEENFNAYFKSIAEVNDEFLFDDSIDNAFIKYVDFHLLENERNAMVKSINLLNDPQGFIEHVQRNQAWMKDLYENKAEYYEDMKNKAFELIEGNALLNELANKGIYISLDDYQKWKDDRVLPDEFYDDINKVVIRPGNPQYDSLAGLFQMINFRDESGAYDPIVKQKLQELDNQLEAEIDKLPKQETKKDLGEISKGRSKFISIEKINENLSDTEYVEATYLATTEGEDTTITFYKDGDILRLNNKDGEEIDVKNFKSLSASKGQFVSAQKFQLVLAPDPVEVEKITKEYQARKEEVVNDYIASGQQTPIEAQKKPLSTESTLEEISAESVDLYNELVVAFEAYAEKAGMTDLAVDDYEEAFSSFIKSNIIASEIINNYKKEKELETGTEANESNRIPMLSLGDRQIKLSDLSEQELRNYLRTFDSGLKVLEEKENPTPEELEKIRNYKYSIRIIEDYLAKSKKEQYTPEQQKTLDKVQKVIDAQDDLLKTKGGYVINGKVLARVTNVIKQFDTEEYKYSAENAVLASYRTTIETDGLNVDSINNFVEQLRKQSLPGFSGFTYDELTRELTALTEKDLSESEMQIEDFILGVVLEKTYEASRIAGNYLDDQLRNIFDNKPAVYNEAQISRDAYDNLFSTDPNNLGYVTQIKNIIDEKGMVVISRITPTNADERGLVVFDEDAGVAGEIDLLVIDKLGKLLILDVKTGKSTKWKGFEKEGNIASKKANYTLQQATYANLLYNLTGEQASIAILPIEIDYEQETGKIIKGKGRPTAPGLIADNDFKINLDITPDIQEKIDSVIPRKVFEDQVVEKPVSSEDGEESPYEEFVDSALPEAPESFGVDPKLLEAINNATQEQLDNVKRVLVEKLGVYDVSEVTQLQEAIDKRQRELTSSPESIKYNSSNTASGSTFIVENTTFTGKNNDELFADTGDTVTVVKTNSADNTLVIKNIDNKQKTISFEELNKMFKLKEQVMNFETAATDQGPLSKEEKDFISESSDNVKELLSKTEAKNILKKEAANQSLDQVDDELFNDTTSNC
jgi:hypothetical protein